MIPNTKLYSIIPPNTIVLISLSFHVVTAGKIVIAMDTTEELFRTDEEHR